MTEPVGEHSRTREAENSSTDINASELQKPALCAQARNSEELCDHLIS